MEKVEVKGVRRGIEAWDGFTQNGFGRERERVIQ